VIPAWIRRVCEAQQRGDQTLPVWGDGSPTREFIYAEDAARGIVAAAIGYDQPDPVNLGTNMEISIKDLIETICDLMGYQGELVWETDKPNGQPRRCLDTQKAEEYFGFKATTSLRDGLKATIDWYRQNAV
jgi:GDP-L-fucose synthase